jgi:hypothetical protein
MSFDGVTWNEALPDNNVLAHQIDDYDRDLRIGVRSRMAREHVWPSSQTGTNEGGHHNFITLQMQTGAPAMVGTTAGGIYIGSAANGYPLMFVNSAGSTFTLVNSAGNIPVISSGTLGSIAICSSANANTIITLSGSTDGYVLTTHSNTAAPNWLSPTSLISGLVGSYTDKTSNYGAQQAATDGYVQAFTTYAAQSAALRGYTDSNSNPTTVVDRNAVENNVGSVTASVKFLVRKGDYWKVTLDAGTIDKVWWIPLGS